MCVLFSIVSSCVFPHLFLQKPTIPDLRPALTNSWRIALTMWMPFSPGKSLPVVWWNLAKEKVRGPTPGPAGERNVCEIGVKRWTKARRVIHFFGHRSVQGENGKWKFMREHNKIQKEAMILWILMPDKIKWNLQPIRMSTNSVPKSPVKIGYENMFLWAKQLLKKHVSFFWGEGQVLDKKLKHVGGSPRRKPPYSWISSKFSGRGLLCGLLELLGMICIMYIYIYYICRIWDFT